jgi:hypothetical protein
MNGRLPTNVVAERFVLGSILTNEGVVAEAMADLTPECFSLEGHRRIFRRACDLYGREEHVDTITVHNELMQHGESESVGGLVSLDDGLPLVPSVKSYIRILHEKAAQRKIVFACQNLMNRVELGDTSAATGARALRVADLPTMAAVSNGKAGIEYIRRPELPRSAVVGVTGDAGEWPTIHPKPCDLRVGSALAGCPRRATRVTDRSRGSCPRADNAAEYQPDRARMLPSELPNPACAGVPQVQRRRGLGPLSGHRRGSFREAVSGRQTVRLFSAESSAIPEFLSLRFESASSTFPQYRACDCNTLAAPGCPLRTSARTCRGRAQGLFQR